MTRSMMEAAMRYSVERGSDRIDELTPEAALAKARELIRQNLGDVYLYDGFGDPMGLCELEQVVVREVR
jgi:hypothetical protein